MQLLVVHANPETSSFGAAVCTAAVEGARTAGHQVLLVDLYAEDFDPCLTSEEHRRYLEVGRDHPDPVVRRHIELLRRADGLVFVYPTWWSGLPAIAKGWLERVLLPEVAFVLDPRTNRVRPGLRNLRRLVGITTLGGPRWEAMITGNAGRRTITRSVRAIAGPRCRTRWLSLHGMDRTTDQQRQEFLHRVRTSMRDL